jgi:succinate-acetate transporter protein
MLTPGKDKGIANPVPLGLACLGVATFVLGFAILFQSPTGWMPYMAEAVVIGGIAQFLAGMWGFAYGDTLAATAFSFFGAVYAWLGVVNMPALAAFGTLSTSATIRAASQNSIGALLVIVGFVALYFWVASFTDSAVVNGSFLLLWISWVLIGVGLMGGFRVVAIAGGAAAILSSIISAYGSFAELFNEVRRREVMPIGIATATRDRVEQDEYERIRRLHQGVTVGNSGSQPASDLRA